jgi:hypothetical protein
VRPVVASFGDLKLPSFSMKPTFSFVPLFTCTLLFSFRAALSVSEELLTVPLPLDES